MAAAARRRCGSPTPSPRCTDAGCSTGSRSRSAPARSSGSPASRATARPSSPTCSAACSSSTRDRRGRRNGRPDRPGRQDGRGRHRPDPRGSPRCRLRARPERRREPGARRSRPRRSPRPRRPAPATAGAEQLIAEFGIDCIGPDAPFASLSGGNQQRVVLARELSAEPTVLVAAQPCRGLDVGAIEFIGQRLRAAADQGIAVLLISNELEEILALADRIVVIHAGSIRGEASPEGRADGRRRAHRPADGRRRCLTGPVVAHVDRCCCTSSRSSVPWPSRPSSCR